jgi:uncharacterized protein YecT (DUF1311 family)
MVADEQSSEFPDLGKLDRDYQILTELQRSDASRSYLARHLQLHRDVTITVFRKTRDNRSSLTRFAADVARLKTLRHPNIIPVIEGRWLDDGTFAVIRARVRGGSLDQLIGAVGVGPIPLARVASTLEQVRSALEWARSNVLANRHLSHDEMIFQQGSGRVLLGFDPPPPASELPADACDDARTVGSLAWEMLAGQRMRTPLQTLAMLRPDLPATLVAVTEALVHCEHGSQPRDIRAYIALFGDGVAVEPRAGAARTDEPPPSLASLGDTETDVDVAKRGWSWHVPLAITVAVAAVVAAMSFLFVNPDAHPPVDDAAGDVTPAERREHGGPVPTAAPGIERQRIVPPATRRHEPPRTPATLSFPSSTLQTGGDASSDSAVRPMSIDACASPSEADQHRCLMNAIDHSDEAVGSVYGRLITALRERAKTAPDDPDPETVDHLRSAQREWLDERDQTCHTIGAGPLYARARGQCFADQSAKRADALEQLLGAITGG